MTSVSTADDDDEMGRGRDPHPLNMTGAQVELWLKVATAALKMPIWVSPVRLREKPEGGWDKVPLVNWKTHANADPIGARKLWEKVSGGPTGKAVMSVVVGPDHTKVVVLDTDRSPGPEWEALLSGVDTLVLSSVSRGMPHYWFRQSEAGSGGEVILGGNWPGGEVKARGYVVLSSDKPLKGDWGSVAEVPAAVAEKLKTAPEGFLGGPDAWRGMATSDEMHEWLDEHSDPEALLLPETAWGPFLDALIEKMYTRVDAEGVARRNSARATVFQACLEATAGLYPADMAMDRVLAAYKDLRARDGSWTVRREQDFEWLWTSFIPKLIAGDKALEIAEIRERITGGEGDGEYFDGEAEELLGRILDGDPDDPEPDEDSEDSEDFSKEDSGEVLAGAIADRDRTTPVPVTPDTPDIPDPHIPVPEPAGSSESAEVVASTGLDWGVGGSSKAVEALTGGSSGDGRKPPVLSSEALWGPHGDLVDALRGYHEVADVGVLGALLAWSGLYMAGGAHYPVGDVSVQGPNPFVLLIGATGAARKSTGMDLAEAVFRGFHGEDPDEVCADFGLPGIVGLTDIRIEGNISSGERLVRVWEPEIRVPTREEREKDVKPEPEYPSRRVMMKRSEASVMWKQSNRDGSTYGDVTCQVFDQTDLSTKAVTTGSVWVPRDKHLFGFLGASTVAMAKATIADKGGMDALSGFGNRFLWLYLPDSGVDIPFPVSVMSVLAAEIRAYRRRLAWRGVDTGTGFGERVRWSEHARRFWEVVYPVLKRGTSQDLQRVLDGEVVRVAASGPTGRTAIVDGLCGRAEGQVIRLALNYGLMAEGLDGVVREGIPLGALRAAASVWAYAQETVEFLFGGSSGSSKVDTLLADLRGRGGWATFPELKAGKWPTDVARIIEDGVTSGALKTGRVKSTGRGRPTRCVAITGTRLARVSAGEGSVRATRLEDVTWD